MQTLIEIIVNNTNLASGALRNMGLLKSNALQVDSEIETNTVREFKSGEVITITIGKRRNTTITVK